MHGQLHKKHNFSKIIQSISYSENTKTQVTLPPSIVYQGPSTTSRVRDGVLGNTMRRFTVYASTVQP